MIVYKILRMVLHLFVGLWTCAIVFPLTDAAGRDWRIKDWSEKLLAICGVHVDIQQAAGAQPPARALIIANHVSWLDVFVINAWQPCRFVAKSDIRDWPLIGWLCARAGTIFIARGKRRDVRRIYEGLVASLEVGERVAFFPEGTTAKQGEILPFHANLFEAAIEAKVPLQLHALRYLDASGRFDPAVDFTDDTSFVKSMIRVLQAGEIRAELRILPVIETAGEHRRELAVKARCAIISVLGYDPS